MSGASIDLLMRVGQQKSTAKKPNSPKQSSSYFSSLLARFVFGIGITDLLLSTFLLFVISSLLLVGKLLGLSPLLLLP